MLPDLVTLLASAPVTGNQPVSALTVLVSVITGSAAAAIISALVTITGAARTRREAERSRVRTTFAEALEAVYEYSEFPYAIRRRRADQPDGERVRLSEGMRQVQARLSYYRGWTRAESQRVGAAYEHLVTVTRKVAGEAAKAAWEAMPITTDSQMIIKTELIDLSPIEPAAKAFLQVSADHLKDVCRGPIWRTVCRGARRVVRRRPDEIR